MIHLYQAVLILARANVAFVVIGGVALRSHGSAYLTQDLDICYSRTKENLQLIADALRPLDPKPRGFPNDLPFVWDWTTIQNGTNFTFKTSLCDIDLLGEVPGIGTYEDALKNSIAVDLEGYSVNILSIEALIKAKETSGRVKDQAGLMELYALRDAISDEE